MVQGVKASRVPLIPFSPPQSEFARGEAAFERTLSLERDYGRQVGKLFCFFPISERVIPLLKMTEVFTVPSKILRTRTCRVSRLFGCEAKI